MSVHDGALDGGRLNQVLGHMSRAQVGAARLSVKLGLNINAYAWCKSRIPDDEMGWQPFSRRMRSSREFLYRSIRHSSAAVRWAV